MKTAIASALALLLLSSTANAMTVGEFVRIARHNPTMADEIFSIWSGARTMHDYLELRADLRGAPYVYCVKEDFALTAAAATDLVFDFLEATPEKKVQDYSDLSSIVVQTMKWKFPCD